MKHILHTILLLLAMGLPWMAASQTDDYTDENIQYVSWGITAGPSLTDCRISLDNTTDAPDRTHAGMGVSAGAYLEYHITRQWSLQLAAEGALERIHAETNGDDNALGLVDIVSQYGAKAGEAVYLYAGVASLRTGAYEEAISYLKKYNVEDNILQARAQACIGDAYVELEDYATALTWFEKAAKTSDNLFSAAYLLKAGTAAEALGQQDKALACYQEIKDKWGNAPEAMEVDKYITRIQFAE